MPTPSPTARPTPTPHPPTLLQLIGQKLVIRISGTSPSPGLLERVRRGEIGGVVLFGDNIASQAQVIALTRALQSAARAGGQPPLLISTDQEGGDVKRVLWAPPSMTLSQMAATGLTSVARAQGTATGAALLRLGINCDLAPVADVPVADDSFMYQQGRTWSFDATTTAQMAVAFARGLRSAGVVPVLKHFPGIGLATTNTDSSVVKLAQPRSAFDAGLRPYELAIEHALPMVMLSNATYTALDPVDGAGWSPAIGGTLLRKELGFTGVTITDSLSGTAKARGVTATDLAIRAAIAGTDMLMLTGDEASTEAAFNSLLASARDGTIPRATLVASYDRIISLKARLP